MGLITEDFIDNLLARTVVVDDCWLWEGARNGNYGQVWYEGRNSRPHRLVAEWAYGPHPDMQVNHKCKNTLCLHPDHLEWVTASENSLHRSGSTEDFFSCGHPRTNINTYWKAGGKYRTCRACQLNRYHSKKEYAS